MTLEEVLDKLHARRSGSQWLAKCPAHADQSPSLSVSEGEAGRVLLHCFAGCTVESICGAMGIKVGDLFSEPREAHKPEPRIVRDVQKQISDLRSRLTPRDRERPVTVICCDPENLDAGLCRALALAVEGELVQVVMR